MCLIYVLYSILVFFAILSTTGKYVVEILLDVDVKISGGNPGPYPTVMPEPTASAPAVPTIAAAKKTGKADITMTCTHGKKKARIKVQVSKQRAAPLMILQDIRCL